jgi:acetoin:2,6-dichlorophenolindophenol oxidoreductase subunit beta
MGTKILTYGEAIAEGLALEMRRDPRVYVAGEDVGGHGGAFGVSGSLFEEFGPTRVLDTPISEAVIVGHGVGAAAAGLRPVVEIMFMDFLGCCMDELCNQAAKMHYMFGGMISVPLVVRTAAGAGINAAAQHSQALEGIVTAIPGLKTVAPATPADAKGLIIASIRDDNPVVFVEDKTLYTLKGEVPEGEYVVPLGKADIKRSGQDVTIVSWSKMVHQSLAAAEMLEKEGVDAEVVDLRTLVPLDIDTVVASVSKTHKLVIVHEAARTGGFGGEVAARVADEGFDLLDAPIRRVTAPDSPVPFSPTLEKAWLPDAAKIKAAVMGLA